MSNSNLDMLAGLSSEGMISCLEDGKVVNTENVDFSETRLYDSIMDRHMVIMRPNRSTSARGGVEDSRKEELGTSHTLIITVFKVFLWKF